MSREKIVSVMGTGTRLMKIGQIETPDLKGGSKVDRRKPKKGIGSLKYNDDDCFTQDSKGKWLPPKHNKTEIQRQAVLKDSLKAFEENKEYD